MSEFTDQQFYESDEQEIHLRDYLRVLRKRKRIIFLVLILVVLTATILTFSAIPLFTASSQVLIERNRGSSNLDTQYYYYEPEFLETQSEIIRSVNVARRVVDKLGLASKYRHYFFQAKDDEISILSSLEETARGWMSDMLSFITSAEQVRSDIPRDQGLIIEAEPVTDEDIIARMISGSLSVQPVNDSKIVAISYTDQDPAMAKLITNAVVKAYMDELLEIKLASSSYSLQWMTSKADEEREKLERSERALQKYMRDNDLVTVENKLTVFPQKLSEFSSQLSVAEAERKELRSLLDQIKAVGSNYDVLENIPLFADNQVLKTVRTKIYTSNQNIKDLAKKYGPKHPVMIKAKDELEVLNNEKRFEVQRIVASTKSAYELAASKEKNLQELLAETKTEVLNLNEKFIQYSVLKRDVDSNRVLYDALETSIKTESVTGQTQSVDIWVVKKADLPGAPSEPNKKRNILLGVILGLLGGMGLAFLVEYLDNTAKSETELEKRYGLSVLGTVEKLDGRKNEIESYVVKYPLSPLAESYRLIRSSLLLSSAEKPPEAILITSMNAQEGKTSTTTNLARILSQGGKKVLIIDCDLRRPRMHSLLNMENDLGLSNYLSGNSDDDILCSVSGEDLTLIPSGPIPPNPAELLSSRKMEELVARMREKFDFILLDSPPVQSVTDSLTLSQIVDGTILVVRYGQTTYEMLDAGMKKFSDVNTRFLGFVLNGLKKGDAVGAYYSSYNSYYAKDE